MPNAREIGQRASHLHADEFVTLLEERRDELLLLGSIIRRLGLRLRLGLGLGNILQALKLLDRGAHALQFLLFGHQPRENILVRHESSKSCVCQLWGRVMPPCRQGVR